MIKYLLGRASTGKFRFAVVECDEEWHSDCEPAGYIIQRSYGQVRGKTTLSPQIIVDRTKQKRNWQEQYTLQFNSEVKKYLDKGYKEIDKHPNEYTDDELRSSSNSSASSDTEVLCLLVHNAPDTFHPPNNYAVLHAIWLNDVLLLLWLSHSDLFPLLLKPLSGIVVPWSIGCSS